MLRDLKRFAEKHGVYKRPDHCVNLIKRVEWNKEYVILDIGSGALSYKKYLRGKGVYKSMDIKPFKGVDYVGDVQKKIPLKDNSVDVVILFQVLEHLHSPGNALKEISRVLKKGGKLLLSTPQYWHTHGHPSDYYRYTKHGVYFLCESNGLKIKHCESMGGPFMIMFHVIELNMKLNRGIKRVLFFSPLCFLFDSLDRIFFNGEDRRENPDNVGWAVVAEKALE